MDHLWGYGDNDGPQTWASKFPAAGGCRQSPVDIRRARVVYDSGLQDTPLTVSYLPEETLTLSNNGHTVKAACGNRQSTLTGGPLGSRVYRLDQFHLHWGSLDQRGSEHTIDGQPYAAEIHLVHWNSTNYNSFAEASTQSDGLAVLCVLITVGSAHEDFEVVSSQLNNVRHCGNTFNTGVTFDPTVLLPGDITRYWTYPGSLTTPPCHESVQFIVLEQVMQFSSKQMNSLRSLRVGDEKSDYLADNFRPTCDLGQRTGAGFLQLLIGRLASNNMHHDLSDFTNVGHWLRSLTGGLRGNKF
ncbi:carbonic anhydrase 2-like [Babylonia areolata]|uniref:carbonic anhydrase 2-like n=1 Tax=Babylonia areolata TaxID=304850 RepID=UPI003FD34214